MSAVADNGLTEEKKPKEDDRPTERIPGVHSRVFELKHRVPDELMGILKPLGSGVRGTTLSSNDQFRMITVRDFPENIASIEETLRRLDTPGLPRPDVELKMRVLIAAPDGPDECPSDLAAVIKQLRANLSYKSYFQVASLNQRVKSGGSSGGKGEVQVSPPVVLETSTLRYSYGFGNVNVNGLPGGRALIQIRRLRFWTGHKRMGEADIGTALSLREGEKVVVGTASLKERAMILVLSAKILK